MHYDIYGNPLSNGQCEAHPGVYEPSPCRECLRKRDNYGPPDTRLDEIEHEHWAEREREFYESLERDEMEGVGHA